MRETDNHHLWWTRADWNKTKINKLIRNEPNSQVEMYIPEHRELHRFVEPITPPVIREMSERVLILTRELPGHYSALDKVKSLRDDLCKGETKYLSEHLGRQIPFLELSGNALKRRVL